MDVTPGAAKTTYLSLWKGPLQRSGQSSASILREVSAEYGVPVEALTGPGRKRTVAYPRFAAMRRLRDIPMPSGVIRSLTEVGKRLGGRDHTTVLNGLRRYAELTGEPFDPATV